jgi:hypothetical protein
MGGMFLLLLYGQNTPHISPRSEELQTVFRILRCPTTNLKQQVAPSLRNGIIIGAHDKPFLALPLSFVSWLQNV